MGSGHQAAEFGAYLLQVEDMGQRERFYELSPEEIERINPNSKTAPVFRSKADAMLTATIYDRVPVLVEERNGAAGDPWGFDYMTKMFDMADSSSEFRTASELADVG